MNVNSKIQAFKDFCREHRYKVTSERIEILKEVCSARGHFDADDLLIKMKKKSRKVSRATIYRTLELLVEMKFLRRERLGGEQYLYECISGGDTHYHCICSRCGIIEEFVDDNVAGRVQETADGLGFKHANHNLKIFGLCPRCQKKEEK